MFESSNGDFDIQRQHIDDKGFYVVTSGLSNNGILGKSSITAKIFNSNTITVDMFGTVFYRNFRYKMVTHARVFSLSPKIQITERQGIFISNSMSFFALKFGYNNMCSWVKIKNDYIQLPTKNGEIDFDFMESFVAELEAQRVAELEAYLNVTGLKDYELTEEEKIALKNLENIEWGEYKLDDLFERISTKKIGIKAVDLPTKPYGKYKIPCLTSSFNNQGLNYYINEDDNITVLKDVISLPSNSDIYRAYYQSRNFTVLSDAYAIKMKNYSDLGIKNLFLVTSINKVTNLKIYSYKNKLGGWNKAKEKYIQLPTKNGKIDFEYMETLVSAIQKLVIKDVVLFAERKIRATEEVIG